MLNHIHLLLCRKLIQSQSTPPNWTTNTVRNSANGLPDGRFLTKTPLFRRKSRIPLASNETKFGFDGVNFGSGRYLIESSILNESTDLNRSWFGRSLTDLLFPSHSQRDEKGMRIHGEIKFVNVG
jgi:hypothetical protein